MRTATPEAATGFRASRDRPHRPRGVSQSGLVPRPRLIDRIFAARQARLVLLTAPAGYSKSTCLREWSEEDERPVAWLAGNKRLDDPAALVFSIVDLLDDIEPVDPDVIEPLRSPSPNISKNVLPRLSRSIHRRAQPFVLVIDDLHLITSPTAVEVIATVIDSLPNGSQVAIASRTEPTLPLGRLRANRQLVELKAGELAMTRDESRELLRGLGVALTDPQLDLIFDRTEGWPAALYLAGFALAEQPDAGKAAKSFAGDDTIVVDYLRDEFLSAMGPERVNFLSRTSILDQLTGPLCDFVLGSSGSADTLEELSRENALVIPLDRRGERYRYHQLFAEMLQSELRRHQPEVERESHRRASRWYEEARDADRAIDHAIDGGEPERAGELIWRSFPEFISRGRVITIARWLDLLGDDANARVPKLALTRAHVHLNLGEGGKGAHWARMAVAAAESSPQGLAPIEADALLIKAVLGVDGVVQVGKDAARSSELQPPDSPWQAPCHWLRGASNHLAENSESAKTQLQEAVRRGAIAAPFVQVMALAQLSLIAKDDDDRDSALLRATQAKNQVDRCGLTDYPSVVLVFAASALATSLSGRPETARADARQATQLLSKIVDLPPWYEAQTRIVLAGASLRLDDLRAAGALLVQAENYLEMTPDAPVLVDWLHETQAALEKASNQGHQRDWSLTTAELRTLQYLPSHLTFREIGERIHVSANTVKTQARAVYRKLDVSSRAEAVERAREAGLLGEDPLRDA